MLLSFVFLFNDILDFSNGWLYRRGTLTIGSIGRSVKSSFQVFAFSSGFVCILGTKRRTEMKFSIRQMVQSRVSNERGTTDLGLIFCTFETL